MGYLPIPTQSAVLLSKCLCFFMTISYSSYFSQTSHLFFRSLGSKFRTLHGVEQNFGMPVGVVTLRRFFSIWDAMGVVFHSLIVRQARIAVYSR